MTNHPPSVLWHCWLGHQTCENRRPYNLYCVGADVKPCSINLLSAPVCKIYLDHLISGPMHSDHPFWSWRQVRQ